MGKSGKNHKQDHAERALGKERARENWENLMKSTKERKMSEGAQNIARSEKVRTHWSGKAEFNSRKANKSR